MTAFIQVNPRNIEQTIQEIESAKQHYLVVIGFEVVEQEVIDVLPINIDPQHTGVKLTGSTKADINLPPDNISATKYVFEHFAIDMADDFICIVLPSKLDIDSICAAALFTLMATDHDEHYDHPELKQRVEAIDQMDTGKVFADKAWNPDFHNQERVMEVTDFNLLGAMCFDFKLPLEEKLLKATGYLMGGNLPEEYRVQVERESTAQQSSTYTWGEWAFPFIQSTARGATSLLYSIHPYGVCFNPEFPVKGDTVRKFTICQWNDRQYLDLQAIVDELNKMEEGWGGNLQAGIIGSPFKGSTLHMHEVCNVVDKYVLIRNI